MSFNRSPLPNVSAIPTQILSIRNFKGLNVLNANTEIDNEESPEMLNIIVNDYGLFENRKGYSRMYPTSLGVGGIKGLYEYIKLDGTKFILMTWGNKLYKVTDGVQPIQITTPHGISSSKTRFFTMGNYCWIYDTINYYRFDGTTVVDVTSIAKIPQVSISRRPDGTGTNVNEDINLLQPGFTDSFSGNTTDTIYHLSFAGLDATPVTIVANNVNRTEGVSFTVDRTAGTINFGAGSSPLGIPGLGTNNVKITAYKTYPGMANLVINSSSSILYGGMNDTRVWFSQSNTNIISFSDNYDASYFPENNFIRVGADYDIVMNFTVQYDTLIVHKRWSKWQVSFTTDTAGLTMYVLKPVNDTVGCIATDSVQNLNNSPVALTENGVFSLTSSNVRDERNVTSISLKIDKLLLKEANLQNAVSVDYEHKYILVLNNNAYVFDYNLGAWFLWNNIPASCFLITNDSLYFGSNTDGLVYKFAKKGKGSNLDDGADIEAYWYSKVFDLGSNSRQKLVEKIFYSMRPSRMSHIEVYYKTDEVISDMISEEMLELFDYSRMSYSTFTYRANNYPTVIMNKIKAKKIMYFQIMFKCHKSDSSFGILNIDIKYSIQGYKK